MARVDLHMHSSASFDCGTEPEEVVAASNRLGLDPVFLTDHDNIAGALRLHGSQKRVVVGEEVMTTGGELIGLFLRQSIAAGLNPAVTAREIKDQGGLIYLVHPYDRFRRHLTEDAIESLADIIDIVEVFNGRADDEANRRAEDLCGILGAARGAGSDAHSIAEIGAVYIEMDDFTGPGDFLVKLRQGRIVRRPSKLLLRVQAMTGHKIRCR